MRSLTSFAFVPAVFAVFAGCTPPDVAEGFYCANQSDCLEGYLCNTLLATCEKADQVTCTDGVCSNELTLGISAPITTGPTEIGRAMKDGIEAYFNHVNTNGYDGTGASPGIHGRRLKLLYKNDGMDPDEATKNVKDLLAGADRNVFAFLGNVGCTTAKSVVPETNKNEVIYFGGLSGSEFLRPSPPLRYVFNFRGSYKQETAAQVGYLVGTHEPKIDHRNIAVFPQAVAGFMDAYGKAGFEGVHSALKKLKGVESNDIVYATYDRSKGKKVMEAAKLFLQWLGGRSNLAGNTNWGGPRPKTNGKINAAIIGVATYVPMATLISEIRTQLALIASGKSPDAKYELQDEETAELAKVEKLIFFSVSSVGTVSLVNQLMIDDMSFCRNVMITQVVPDFGMDSTVANTFRDHLKNHDSNLKPGFVSFEGYLVARLFVKGLQMHGDRAVTSDELVGTFESLEADFGLGADAKLAFNQNRHQALDKIWGVQLDGKCQISPIPNW